MTDISIIGVVGTDGVQPIFQPDGRWCWWSIGEIFNEGTVGQNKYVPKINDYVIDPETYTTYRVTYLDPVTLYPTLEEIRPANMSFGFSETDILFGVGPGTQADTYRVYIDKSVMPYILAVDIRLRVAGTMAKYAKLFKGANLTNTGHVVSKVYDSNGNFISENVPLELVALDSHVNYSIKTVAVCHTVEDLVNGEIVTAVIYNDQGHVVSKRQLLVEETSFIRSINASRKYVSHISLENAFLSPTFDHRIEFPLNIPINAINLMGIVHYSDGDTLRLPVDGSKFTMHGLEQYLSTIIGQKVDMVLSYALSENETAYAGVTSDGHYVTEPYELITVNPNNSYSVKLFGYPIWVSEATGYVMQWWLFNLDRNVWFDVTPYVRFADNTGPYDPKGYGYLQHKTVSINLHDVSGAFNQFIHVQTVDIVLNGFPDVSPLSTAWTMSHESITGRPFYGTGLYAKKVSDTELNLSSGIATYEEWLERVYSDTFPLVDRSAELTAPVPTHFVVTINGVSTEYPVANWNANIVVNQDITVFKTITLRFVKKTGVADMQLGISAMLVKP